MGIEKYAKESILSGKFLLMNKWITQNETLKNMAIGLFPKTIENFNILSAGQSKKTKHKVLITTVKGTPYEEMRNAQNTRVYVGGPGSMAAAALDSVLTHRGSSNGQVVYLNYDFQCSNAKSSAYYYHLRHSTALNSDSRTRGARLLLSHLIRCTKTRERLIQDALKINYLKMDISAQDIFRGGLSSSIAACTVMVGIVLHTMQNNALSMIGMKHKTDWTRNCTYSQSSTPVMQYLESAAVKLGICKNKECLLTGYAVGGKEGTGNAISVIFHDWEETHVVKENKKLRELDNLPSRRLQFHELKELMGGDCKGLHGGYLYPSDGRITGDMNLILSELVTATGNMWKESVIVEKIFMDGEGIRGIEYKDTKTDKREYLPCSSAVFSLGYTSKYEIDSKKWDILNFKRCPTEYTTVAAGCSGYVIMKGRIPSIATHLSHYTELDYSPEKNLSICKFTAGGNIGSEHAQLTYILNSIEQMKRLFGNRVLGILSVESCPRVINRQNDVQFYRLANGLHIAVGLGGTGITKMGANGAMSVLLSNPHISPSSLLGEDCSLFQGLKLSSWVKDRTQVVSRYFQ